MKFPLLPRPFLPLELSNADHNALVRLSSDFLDETLTHYEHFLHHNRGEVDPSQWKLLKTRENVSIYQERRPRTAGAATRKDDTLQVMLGCGAMPGHLNDVMYGVLNSTRESMTLRSSYIEDNVVDCAVLAPVIHPTVKDPMRSLQVKWSVNASPPAVRHLVRPRDFVYLESTGMTTLPSTGETVGYHILHSIEIPGVKELHEHNIVRGNLSLFYIYRQRPGNQVGVYIRGFCDPKGDMRPSIAAFAAADGMIAVWKTMVCSHKKKLAWLYRHRQRLESEYSRLPRRYCAICNRSVRGRLRSGKRCHICDASVCASCRVSHKLCFMEPAAHRVLVKPVRFCKKCLGEGLHLNGWDLAADELARDSKQEYPDTLNSSIGSSRSVQELLAM